jgi:trehalose 6-phosphate phosphatase
MNTGYECFFRQLRTATSRVLVMDYESTVAPFHAERQATAYSEISELLHCIITLCHTRLIVVSGRAAQEIAALLDMNPLPEIWGAYGIEKIHQGRYEVGPINEDALNILAHAEAELGREGLGHRMEFKVAGMVLHWQGLLPAEALDVRTRAYRVLQSVAAHPDLVLAEFRGGVELRLSSATMADALDRLLLELDSRIPIAYLGSDGHEEPFRTLNSRGLSVLVGPKPPCTAAYWLKPPHDLVRFLLHWIVACGGVQ